MSQNLDSMLCENPEYKKKHVPAKRVGLAMPKKELPKDLEVKK